MGFQSIPLLFTVALGLSLVPAAAFSERAVSSRTSDAIVYHGKLVRPNGSVIDGDLTVQIKITSPEPTKCLLWAETQTVKATNGGFSVELGYSDNRSPGVNGGVADSFRDVFINNAGLSFVGANCEQGATYTPGATDDRLMSAVFVDNGVTVSTEIIPIKSVPFAKQAQEIAGYGINNLMKISGGGAASVVFSPSEVQGLKTFAEGKPVALGSANSILGVNAAGNTMEYKTLTAGSNITINQTVGGIEISATGGGGGGSGSVESVGVGGLPLSVVNASTSPVISIAQASSGAAGYLSSADWSAFNSKQPAGAYLTAVPANSVGAGEVNDGTLSPSDLNFAGSMAVNTGVVVRDSTQFYTKTCGANETLIWSVANGWVCNALVLSESDPQVGANTTNMLSKWDGSALVSSGVSESSGNVGIGTSSPSGNLDIYSSVGGRILLRGATNFDSYISIYDGSANAFNVLHSPTTDRTIIQGKVVGDEIQMTTNFGAFRFNTANGSGTDVFSILSNNGNVGIGTATPGAKLEVTGQIKITGGAPGAGKVLQSDADGLASWATLGGSESTAVSNIGIAGVGVYKQMAGSTIELKKINSAGLPITISDDTGNNELDIGINQANGSQAGYISAADWTLFNSKQPAGAYLTSEADPKVGENTTNMLSKWNGSALVASGVFEGGGNVGIGTGSPTYPLEVNGTVAIGGSTGGRLQLVDGGTRGYIGWNGGNVLKVFQNAVNVQGGLNVESNNSFTADVDTLVVDPSTNSVGIGTASPGAKLEVAGQVKITGGSPGAGKFLRSDSSGLAIWESIDGALVSSSLGYTPVNRAGDSMTGGLNLPSNGFAVGTNQLVVSGGYTGLGTATPSSLLTLRDSGTKTTFLTETDGNNTLKISRTGASPSSLELTASTARPTVRFDGDGLWFSHISNGELMRISSTGNIGLGTTSTPDRLNVVGGGVTAQSIQAVGAPSYWGTGAGLGLSYGLDVGSIRAYNNTSGTGTADINFITAGAEKMRIKSGGNVGIGTSSPDSKLEIKTSASNQRALALTSFTGAVQQDELVTGIDFVSEDTQLASKTSSARIDALAARNHISGTSSAHLVFSTADDISTNVSEKMRITHMGRVGIGTASPGAKLEVGGQVKITGGSPGAGKILQSDADGLATWVTPSSSITSANLASGNFWLGNGSNVATAVAMSGDVTMTNAGVATVGKINNTTVSGVGLANNNILQNTSGSAISGNNVLVSNGTGTGVTALTTPINGVLISNGSSVPTWGALSSDLFTQYAALGGRSGGQTIRGGTAAGEDLFLDSTSNGTKGDIILNATGGNVGIGTTSPGAKLHVNSSAVTTAVLVESTNASGQAEFQSKANGTSWISGAGVGLPGATSYGIFNSTLGVNAMTLTTAGRVGVGTTSPTEKMEVGDASSFGVIQATGGGTQWGAGLRAWNKSTSYPVSSFLDFGAGTVAAVASLTATREADGSTDMELAPSNTSGSRYSSVFLDGSTGAVGIGTTTPASQLTVAHSSGGDIAVQDTAGSPAYMRMIAYQGANYIQSAINTTAGSSADLHFGSMLDNDKWMTIKSNGNVGIGTSSPTLNAAGKMIHLHEPSAGAAAIHFTNSTSGAAATDGLMVGQWSDGNAYIYNYDNTSLILGTSGAVRASISGSTGNFLPGTDTVQSLGQGGSRWAAVHAVNGTIQTSDRRLKRNIQPANLGLEFINELQPVSFNWKKGESKNKSNYGFIAQDLEKALLESGAAKENGIVNYDTESDTYAVNYSQLIAPVVNAIQELYKLILGHDETIAEMQKELKDKDQKIEDQEQEISALKSWACSKDPGAPFCRTSSQEP